MRYPYTLDTRYSHWHSRIRDCCNHSHVRAYIQDAHTETRLLALQVMRDYGLLPHIHRKLAKFRRQYWHWRAETQRLFQLVNEDYKTYWPQYVAAKTNAREVLDIAEQTYGDMFFAEEWQAWKKARGAVTRGGAMGRSRV